VTTPNPLAPPFTLRIRPQRARVQQVVTDDEISLVKEFGISGDEEILGYDDAEDDEDNYGDAEKGEGEEDLYAEDDGPAAAHDSAGEDVDLEDEGGGDGGDQTNLTRSPASFRTFQLGVRVQAAKRAEGNRRAGGLKTQRAMVRAWEVSSGSLLYTGYS
jgi:hypothetical protein